MVILRGMILRAQRHRAASSPSDVDIAVAVWRTERAMKGTLRMRMTEERELAQPVAPWCSSVANEQSAQAPWTCNGKCPTCHSSGENAHGMDDVRASNAKETKLTDENPGIGEFRKIAPTLRSVIFRTGMELGLQRGSRRRNRIVAMAAKEAMDILSLINGISIKKLCNVDAMLQMSLTGGELPWPLVL